MVTQINLKFQDNMYDMVKDFAGAKGYMSIQEFIREAVRDKIFDELEIREEYKKVLESKDANTFNTIKDSKKFIEELRLRVKNERL